jgi:peptide/nickel transport system permease protein
MPGSIPERVRGSDELGPSRLQFPCHWMAQVWPALRGGGRMSAVVIPSISARRPLARLLIRDKVALAAALLLAGVILMALFAPVLAPYDPAEQHLRDVLRPPAWHERGISQYVLGTDGLGRDNLSRIIYASRVSLLLALCIVAVTLVIGTLIGLLSGVLRGKVDQVFMAVTDAVMAFPGLLMIMAVAAVLGGGVTTIIVALSVRYWTTYARVVRGMVISLRESEFVLAAQVLGGSSWHAMRVHMLPNTISPLAALIPLELGRTMLAEASVSFLGFGVQPPITSWGLLVGGAQNYIASAPWLIIYPGLALFLTILAANVFGSWLRLAVDPIHRGRMGI